MTHAVDNQTQGIAAFNGHSVEVWSYTCSHARLTIRFCSANAECRYLVLTFCTHISLPTTWIAERPWVEVVNDGAALRFSDTDVSVMCLGAKVFLEDPT